MVGANANTYFKVYCVCCVSSEPNMLLYFCVYTYIYRRLSPILLSQPTRVVACLRSRYLIYIYIVRRVIWIIVFNPRDIYTYTYIHIHIHIHIPTYLPTYIHTYLPIYKHTHTLIYPLES